MQLSLAQAEQLIRSAAGCGVLAEEVADATVEVLRTSVYSGGNEDQTCDSSAVFALLRRKQSLDEDTLNRLMREHGLAEPAPPGGVGKPAAERDIADSFTGLQMLGWDRYEVIELLGRGGMGDVYLARDPRLDRLVAVKLLHRDDPEVVRRFTREAQLQARIDHDNVCPVYEVGEVSGRPFIVMQYLSGGSLKELAQVEEQAGPTIHDRVGILADVACALHAAHEHGLIHRDIKPANIMLEPTADGWRPYVVDFGIARDLTEHDLTISGQVLGTPAFSAPEQVRGDNRHIDRRTDIYSLGATLYWFLAGRPPFAGGFPEIIARVDEDDPEPLRTLNPRVPADLETIVLHCLEKEPQRRYQTARDLADDLRRFLVGEAIAARPPSLGYRLGKRLRKHRRLVAAAAVALLLFLVLAGLSLRATVRARRQALVAQRLIEQVKEIESLARITAMMPEHDCTPEQELIRTRVGQLQDQLSALDTLAQGPAHYAIGRGYLVLEDWQAARLHLRQAEQLGYHTPAVSYALGLVLGRLYEEELEQVRQIPNEALRAASRADLEQQLREPALEHLRRGGELRLEVPAYGEALLLHYEGRYDEALATVERAAQHAGWLWEARQLQGDIRVAQGLEQTVSGNHEAALQALESAGESYRTAAEIARSAAGIHERDCGRLAQMMEIRVRSGQDPQATFDAALAACERAVRIDPGRSQVHTRIAHLYWRRADHLNDRGLDPRPVLEQAISAADQAIAIDPGSAAAHYTRGGALTVTAMFQMGRGEDPHESLNLAIASLQAAVDARPGFVQALDDLGYAHERIARHEMDSGADPRPSLARAVECYRRANELQPSYPNAHNNSGIALWRRGCYERRLGLDPRASLEAACQAYGRAISLNPNYAYAHANLGLAHGTLARSLVENGADPLPEVSEARASLERALELNKRIYWAYQELAAIELLAARWRLQEGGSPQQHLARAEHLAAQARQLNPHNALALQVAAEVRRWRAEWLLRQGRPVQSEVAAGRRLVEEALTLKPDHHNVLLTRAALILIQAESEAASRTRRALAREAETQLDCAIRGNPLLEREVAELRSRAQTLLEVE